MKARPAEGEEVSTAGAKPVPLETRGEGKGGGGCARYPSMEWGQVRRRSLPPLTRGRESARRRKKKKQQQRWRAAVERDLRSLLSLLQPAAFFRRCNLSA